MVAMTVVVTLVTMVTMVTNYYGVAMVLIL